jgi:hypothetical protein
MDVVPNLTEAEMKDLQSANSETEWNLVCDRVKGARNGIYPPDWFAQVVVAGVAASAHLRWNGTN